MNRFVLVFLTIGPVSSLAGCGEVHERVLTPTVIADPHKFNRISAQLSEDDRGLLMEYAVVHRIAQREPKLAPPIFSEGPHTVTRALDISRQMKAIDEACQKTLSPIGTRIAEAMTATTRDDALLDALNKTHHEASVACKRQRWAVK